MVDIRENMVTADIHIKVDADVKSESEKILKKIGKRSSLSINLLQRRMDRYDKRSIYHVAA